MRADTRWEKKEISSQHFTKFQIWFEKLFDEDGKHLFAAHASFGETWTPLLPRAPTHDAVRAVAPRAPLQAHALEIHPQVMTEDGNN